MAKFDKKLLAVKLRRNKGLSINRIAQLLEVSKGSVSLWCRDIKLTEVQERRLLENSIKGRSRGSILGALTNKRKKEARIDFHKNKAEKELGNLSKRDILIAGVALYWAEGSKTTQFTFVNTDPVMILFFYKWLREMGVGKNDIIPRIFINQIHQSRIKIVIRYWSSLLKLPTAQFRKTIFIKTKQKKVYENYERYFGLLAIRVRNSSELKYRTLGLVGALSNFAMPV